MTFKATAHHFLSEQKKEAGKYVFKYKEHGYHCNEITWFSIQSQDLIFITKDALQEVENNVTFSTKHASMLQ